MITRTDFWNSKKTSVEGGKQVRSHGAKLDAHLASRRVTSCGQKLKEEDAVFAKVLILTGRRAEGEAGYQKRTQRM